MSEPLLTNTEIERMRSAGIAVPETIEEVRKLLEEAEKDPEKIPLDEAFRQIRARLLAGKASKSA
jgi:hypothetical protein